MACEPGPAVSALAGHGVQLASPAESAYAPCGQAEQVSVGSLIVPACPLVQAQSVTRVQAVPSPLAHVVVVASAGHCAQAAALVAKYCPT